MLDRDQSTCVPANYECDALHRTVRRILYHMRRLAYGVVMDSEEIIGLLLFGAFAGVVILAFTSFVL